MIKKLLLILSLMFFLGLFLLPGKSFVQATCGNFVCETTDNPDDCTTEELKDDCSVGSICDTPNCPSPQPANVCCRPGVSCPGDEPTWTYAHDPQCRVDYVDAWTLNCSWHWQYQNCSAGDRCSPCTNGTGPEKVCAGICTDSGCASGGWYKTCCQVNGSIAAGSPLTGVNGSCTGGGGCSGDNVTIVRWGNFGSPGPSCDPSLCLDSWDGYSWSVVPCSATASPTSGPTSPPAASPPPTYTCYNPTEGWWCVNLGDNCPSGSNELVGKTCSNGGKCCKPVVYQQTTNEFSLSCPTSVNQGETAVLTLRQKPCKMFLDHGDGDNSCFFNDIPINATSGPRTGVVSTRSSCVSPLDHVCVFDIWNSNVDYLWDTTGWPAGDYVLNAYFPGHEDYGCTHSDWGAACLDPPRWATCYVKVNAPPPPPICAIFGSLTVTVGEEAQFCVTAENADTGSEIWSAPLGSNLSLGSSWTNIRPKTVGNGCQTTTFSQLGTYHVNCNAYGDGGACTGNPGCPWGTHPYPGFTCSDWTDCGDNDSLVVTVTPPRAWYQAQGGNVYGQVVSTLIPSLVTNRYFSLSSSWSDSGLVSSSVKEPEPADFNNAQVSQTDSSWRAQGNLSAITNRYTYQYFTSLLDINEANEAVNFQTDVDDLPNPAQLDGGKDIVVYSGDSLVINDAWGIGSRKIIAFVNGDLTINEPISIAGDGFLALIVNGDLTIDIGASPESVSPLLQGVYIVDGAIIIPEREAEPKFVGEGIFFARGGFSLEKDLNDANVSYPAELFIFNPRYLFAAPRILRYAPQFWQELAP